MKSCLFLTNHCTYNLQGSISAPDNRWLSSCMYPREHTDNKDFQDKTVAVITDIPGSRQRTQTSQRTQDIPSRQNTDITDNTQRTQDIPYRIQDIPDNTQRMQTAHKEETSKVTHASQITHKK